MDVDVAAPEDLAAELLGLLRPSASTSQLLRCPQLLSLAITRGKSASDQQHDLAVAAQVLLREGAARVDDERNGPAAILLGLATGSRGTLLKERRRRAAEALYISVEHLRKDREVLLMEAVADELYAADSIYRLRQRHRERGERPPEQTTLGVNWLEQHRSYRRIWTPLYGMKADCLVLMGYLREGEEDHEKIADRLVNITWQWARFETAIQRFIAEQGGLWLLSDAEQEQAAADAIYRAQLLIPLGATDASWMRTMLAETPHHELDGFGDRLIEAGEDRRVLMGAWVAWLQACSGDLEAEDPGCTFHAWIDACDTFIRLIDEDWFRVADWYRTDVKQAP